MILLPLWEPSLIGYARRSGGCSGPPFAGFCGRKYAVQWEGLLRLVQGSYGEVACQFQGEILQNLANPHRNISTDANEIAEAVFKKMSKAGMNA